MSSLTLDNLRTMRDDLARMMECLPAGTIARYVVEMQYHGFTYLIGVTEDAGADELRSDVLLGNN